MVDLSALSIAEEQYLTAMAGGLDISVGILTAILTFVSLWALAWKGVALWKAAKKKSVPWFVVLLIVNTMGILEILYIFIFSKMSFKSKAKTVKKKKR